MPTDVITVTHASGEYPIYLGSGLLQTAEVWSKHLRGLVLVVTEKAVAQHQLDPLCKALDQCCEYHTLTIESGEESKSVAQWSAILDELVHLGAQRDATIIALGGGMVGDLAGFVAATYMRGIQFITMPTTLLAQVDAAIGGKTAINHPQGKNLIGAFHAPICVVVDTATLHTLPERDYRAGLAEVVKYGAIRDRAFFEWLEQHMDALNTREAQALHHAINCSVRNKQAVVVADEKEQGERALLNFGHTFGHALEAAGGYHALRHGEAVAIGMVLAARLSETLGLAPKGIAEQLKQLLTGLGLPTEPPAQSSPEALIEIMRLDKKNRDNTIHLVLLKDLGEAFVRPCSDAEIRRAFSE